MGFAPAMAGISGGLSLASGLISGMGARQQGEARGRAADYTAAVADNAAAVARENQRLAESTGMAREAAQGMKTRSAAGKVRTEIAANNVDVNTGSVADVQAAVASLGALDALTIRDNTAREVYGYRVAENEAKSKADLSRAEAANARRAGKVSELTSYLGAASSVAGKFAGWSNVSPGGGSPGPASPAPVASSTSYSAPSWDEWSNIYS